VVFDGVSGFCSNSNIVVYYVVFRVDVERQEPWKMRCSSKDANFVVGVGVKGGRCGVDTDIC
jgi:hypothetical protein